MAKQMTLPVDDPVDQTFEAFVCGPNPAAVAALLAVATGESEDWPFVTGPAGSGKTHLLRACCQQAVALGRSAVYLAVPNAEYLRELSDEALVAIDDVQRLVGNDSLEEALFHLFNRLRASGGTLITASRAAPSELNFRLPDLRSRLSWGTSLRLDTLSDDDKALALRSRAERRDYDLPESVVRYLLRRGPRNLGELMRVLDRLEAESLEAQRTLTVPFVKQLFLV